MMGSGPNPAPKRPEASDRRHGAPPLRATTERRIVDGIRRSSAASQVGALRSENEDSFVADDANGIYVVADGVGGRRGGAAASQIAAETAHAFAVRASAEPSLLAVAHGAMQAAAASVFAETKANPRLSRMATTLSVLLLRGNWAAIAHVGDTRIHRVRADVFEQLTDDHTPAAEIAATRNLHPDDLDDGPAHHVLTRCLGRSTIVPAQVARMELEPSDVFVLASDGAAPGLRRTPRVSLHSGSLDSAVDSIVERAGRAGSTDDATVVVVRACERRRPHELR